MSAQKIHRIQTESSNHVKDQKTEVVNSQPTTQEEVQEEEMESSQLISDPRKTNLALLEDEPQ